MHAHEDRLVVSVCVGSHGRESLGMNSSMQAMAGRCGAWGWTCALSATVGVVACISLPCNPINSNTIPENAAPLAAPKTHRVRVEFVRVFLLAAHRALLAGASRSSPPIVLCSPALTAVRQLTLCSFLSLVCTSKFYIYKNAHCFVCNINSQCRLFMSKFRKKNFLC